MREGSTKNRHRGGERVKDRAGEKSHLDRTEAAAKLARAVGNDEMRKRVSAGKGSRDALMAHLIDRLKVMRELQMRELQALQRGANYDWWRLVSDPKKKETTPDATRWRQPAQLYEKAAEQLCRGDVRAGRALMERAITAEQKARDELTAIVDERNLFHDPDMAMLADIGDQPECGPCDEPPDVAIATEIQLETNDGIEAPGRRRRRFPWWTFDEDEEEEEDGGAG